MEGQPWGATTASARDSDRWRAFPRLIEKKKPSLVWDKYIFFLGK